MFLLFLTNIFLGETKYNAPLCPASFPDSITSYFTAPIKVNTYNLFNLEEVSLDKDLGNGDIFILEKAALSDLIEFSVYFTGIGIFSIKIICGNNTETYTFTIHPPQLQLSFVTSGIDQHQLITGSKFTLIGSVINSNNQILQQNLDSFDCNWKISGYTNPTDFYIEGPDTAASINNQCIFEGIRIKVSGSYEVTMHAAIAGGISASIPLSSSSQPLKFV